MNQNADSESIPSTPAVGPAHATAGHQPDGPVHLPSLLGPDPELHTRLRLNASVTVRVGERAVILESDAAGCRPVIGKPASGEKTIEIYGCSLVFGMSAPAGETFCTVL
jgi:hypothetical protein